MKVSISNAWEESTSLLKRNTSPLAAIALAFFVLPTTLLGTVSPNASVGMAPADGAATLLMLLVLLIGLVGRLAVAKVALGPSTTVGDVLGHAVRRSASAAVAFVLFMLPVGLAITPFLLRVMQNPTNPPATASSAVLVIALLAIVLSVRLLTMVIPAAVSEQRGPIGLLRRSWQLTAGNWWRILGFVVLFYLAAGVAAWAAGRVIGSIIAATAGAIEPMTVSALILSAILGVIGAVFSVLFASMLARIYAQLTGAGEAQASVPTTGT